MRKPNWRRPKPAANSPGATRGNHAPAGARRLTAALTALALAVAGLSAGLVHDGGPAQAAGHARPGLDGYMRVSNVTRAGAERDNEWYAYLQAGEKVRVIVEDPFASYYPASEPDPVIRANIYNQSNQLVQQCQVVGRTQGASAQCEATAGTAGFFRVQFTSPTLPPEGTVFPGFSYSNVWAFRSDIWVLTGSGGELPGRVFAERMGINQDNQYQSGTYPHLADWTWYALADDGSLFKTDVKGYGGVDSAIVADGLGNFNQDTCRPDYASYTSANMTSHPRPPRASRDTRDYAAAEACGSLPFLLFPEPPSAALPASGRLPGDSADRPINPAYKAPAKPAPALKVDPNAPHGAPYQGVSGKLGIDGFRGEYQVLVDVDGDGSYTGPADITRTYRKEKAAGDVTWTWDGKDKNGKTVTAQHVNISVQLTKGAEYHQVLGDVEWLTGGIQIAQLRGYLASKAGNPSGGIWPKVHWDDTDLLGYWWYDTSILTGGAGDVKTPPEGVSTQGYRHGWDWDYAGQRAWGDNANIEFATWDDLSKDTTLRGGVVAYDQTAEMVSKTGVLKPPAGNPLARSIEYTWKVKNTSRTTDPDTGTTYPQGVLDLLAWTKAKPLVVTDTLPAHVSACAYTATAFDKGSAPGDASAVFGSGKLAWSGPLKAGETATVTYTCKVDAGFAPSRVNTAGITGCPESGADTVQTDCDRDPVNNETKLPGLSIAKTVDTSGLHERGHLADYTVTVTNIGKADYTAADPAWAWDDLTEVLDDAAFDPATLAATAGTATWDPDTSMIAWTGPLKAGQSAKITYQVAYDPHLVADPEGGLEGSDLWLHNTAWIRPVDVIDTTPGEKVETGTPGSDLHVLKTVDAEQFRPGQVATFTVVLSNLRGKADAPVDLVDDLGGVLDDADWVDGSFTTTDPAVIGGFDPDTGLLSIKGKLAAGTEATLTYQVRVKADGRGDNRLKNAVIKPGGDTDCPPGAQNCTDTPVAAYTVAKTSATDSGLPPKAGEQVHYTVTVANTGAVPVTVDEHDHLEWVADDADVTNLATDSATVTAVLNGLVIDIAGTLEVGETVNVTYDAVVKARDGRGDQVMVNVVYPGTVCPEDPDGECVPPDIPVEVPAGGWR